MTLTEAIIKQDWDSVPKIIEQLIQGTTHHSKQPNSGGILLESWIKHGDALYRANQWACAVQCFEHALTLSPSTKQRAKLHGWLAELYTKPIDKTGKIHSQIAQYHAEQAFLLNDQWTSDLLTQRKALSYSLYGDLPVYCENMVINAQLRAEIYPDWDILVYHDHSVPPLVLQRLQALGVQLIDIHQHHASHMPGTFWRFLALERDEYDIIIMRDADSLISEREKLLVDDWLTSGKPFHVIRDWYSHTDLILAGLWGARYGLLQPIRTWIERYLQETPHLHRTHADQIFLARYIWQRIKHSCLQHSSHFHVPGGKWLYELPQTNIINHHRQQLGSWQVDYYPCITVSNGNTVMQLFDENKQLICEYTVPDDGKIELPSSYIQRLQKKQWSIHFTQIFNLGNT